MVVFAGSGIISSICRIMLSIHDSSGCRYAHLYLSLYAHLCTLAFGSFALIRLNNMCRVAFNMNFKKSVSSPIELPQCPGYCLLPCLHVMPYLQYYWSHDQVKGCYLHYWLLSLTVVLHCSLLLMPFPHLYCRYHDDLHYLLTVDKKNWIWITILISRPLS